MLVILVLLASFIPSILMFFFLKRKDPEFTTPLYEEKQREDRLVISAYKKQRL